MSWVYNVAVVDLIQLPGSLLRGAKAKDIHLCGERAEVDLVKAMCIATG